MGNYIKKRIEALDAFARLNENSDPTSYDACYSQLISLLVTNDLIYECDNKIAVIATLVSALSEGETLVGDLDLRPSNYDLINKILSNNQSLKTQFINEVLSELNNIPALKIGSNSSKAVSFLKYMAKNDGCIEEFKDKILIAGLQAIAEKDTGATLVCARMLNDFVYGMPTEENQAVDSFYRMLEAKKGVTKASTLWNQVIAIGSDAIVRNDTQTILACAKLLEADWNKAVNITELNASEKFIYSVIGNNEEVTWQKLSKAEIEVIAKCLADLNAGKFTKLLEYGATGVSAYFKLNRRDDLKNPDLREGALKRINDTIKSLNNCRVGAIDLPEDLSDLRRLTIMKALSLRDIERSDLEKLVSSDELKSINLERFLAYNLSSVFYKLNTTKEVHLVDIVSRLGELSPEQYGFYRDFLNSSDYKGQFANFSLVEQVEIVKYIENEADVKKTQFLLKKLKNPCASDFIATPATLGNDRTALSSFCNLRNAGFLFAEAWDILKPNTFLLHKLAPIVDRKIPERVKQYDIDSEHIVNLAFQDDAEWGITREKLRLLTPHDKLNSVLIELSETTIEQYRKFLSIDAGFNGLTIAEQKDFLMALKGLSVVGVKFCLDNKLYQYTCNKALIKNIVLGFSGLKDQNDFRAILEQANKGFRLDNLVSIYTYFQMNSSQDILKDCFEYANKYAVFIRNYPCMNIIETLDHLSDKKLSKIKSFVDKYNCKGTTATLIIAMSDAGSNFGDINKTIDTVLSSLMIIYNKMGASSVVKETVFSNVFLTKFLNAFYEDSSVLNMLNSPFLEHMRFISENSFDFYAELAKLDLGESGSDVLDKILRIVDDFEASPHESLKPEYLENLKEIVKSYNSGYLDLEHLKYFSFRNILRDELKVSCDDLIELNENLSGQASLAGGVYYDKTGKLFINLSEDESVFDLHELKMNLETFQKLFPARSLYTACQGDIGNCFLISSFNALINSPRGKELFLNSFSQEEGGVGIKLYNSSKVIFYDKDVLFNQDEHVYGSLGWRLLEKYYSYLSFGLLEDSTLKDALEVEGLIQIKGHNNQSILDGGSAIFKAFMPSEWVKCYYPSANVIDFDTRRSIYAGSKVKLTTLIKGMLSPNHAYCLAGVEKKNSEIEKVYLINPHNSACKIELTLGQFLDNFEAVYCVNFDS